MIFELCVLLLAGAIVNVAVAWVCVRWSTVGLRHGREATGFGVTLRFDVSDFEALSRDWLSGWPMRSLWFDGWGRDLSGWIEGDVKWFPIAALWPGFAINTVFYTAVLWVLFAAPGALQRTIRRRRGQCTRCGYDLRGLPSGAGGDRTCPECGNPSPLPRVEIGDPS